MLTRSPSRRLSPSRARSVTTRSQRWAITTVVWCVALTSGASAWGADDPKQKPADKSLFVMNSDGSELRPLTVLPDYTAHGSPDWSRDGTRIAFDAWRPELGETYTQAKIVVVNADGMNPRVLGDGALPSLSPQAKRIVFSRYSPNQGVWVMSSEGPDKELVLLDENGWGATWSPDGKQIAYTVNRDGRATFVAQDLIEGTSRDLFPEGESPYQQIYWSFGWSPDSQAICFRGRRPDNTEEVAIVRLDDPAHRLTVRLREKQLGNSYVWHPNGETILASLRDRTLKRRQLYLLTAAGDQPPVALPGQPTDTANVSADWSPDGKRIVFARQ